MQVSCFRRVSVIFGVEGPRGDLKGLYPSACEFRYAQGDRKGLHPSTSSTPALTLTTMGEGMRFIVGAGQAPEVFASLVQGPGACHSERSEESLSATGGFFAALRMTGERVALSANRRLLPFHSGGGRIIMQVVSS